MIQEHPPTAILLLDFINDIVNTESPFPGAAKVVERNRVIHKANEIIRYARAHGYLIIFVKVAFSADYVECPRNVETSLFHQVPGSGAYRLDTWGTEFHPDLDYQKDDIVVTKYRVSALYATGCEAILRANQIKRLVLMGVSTDLVVQTTARDAHDRDYEVVVIQDACAADDEATSDNVLKLLPKIAKVVTGNEFISES